MDSLKKLIESYAEGKITQEKLIEELIAWDYIEQDSNSSPWAADAQYVEGSWDDVQLANDQGMIPDDVMDRIYEEGWNDV